jgi:excisionase family DNA binding protein
MRSKGGRQHGSRNRKVAEPLVIDVKTAAERLGIGYDRALDAVAAGHIPSIPMGSRRVVPVAALERMLSGEPLEAA